MPAEPSLAYFEWSADPSLDRDDPEALRQANPAYGIRINAEFSQLERDAMTDDEFDRERLGIFPDADDAPRWLTVTEEAWESCADDFDAEAPGWLSGDVDLVVEMDQENTRAWVLVAGIRPNGYGVDIAAELTDPSQVVAVVANMHVLGGVRRVVIDPRSSASSQIDGLEAAGVPLHECSTRDVVQATGQMVIGLNAGTIRHRRRPDLTTAASVATLRKAGEAQVVDRWADPKALPFMGATIAAWSIQQSDAPKKGKQPGRYW